MEVKIGIDLDGVIGQCAEYVLKELYEMTGKIIFLSDLTDHRMSKSLPDMIPYLDQIMTDRKLVQKMDRYLGRIETLNYMKRAFEGECDLHYHIITARDGLYPEVHEDTKVWLDGSGLMYDQLSLVEKHSNKSDIALENGISIFIEDRIENVIALDQAGIKSILIQQPWNDKHEISESISKVHNEVLFSRELHNAIKDQIEKKEKENG